MTGETSLQETEQLAEFVRVVRVGLAGRAMEEHGPAGGWTWTWSHRGAVWMLRAGSILQPGVELTGPAGHWQCPVESLRAADEVLLLLRIAGALPPLKGAATGTTYPWRPALADAAERMARGEQVFVDGMTIARAEHVFGDTVRTTRGIMLNAAPGSEPGPAVIYDVAQAAAAILEDGPRQP